MAAGLPGRPSGGAQAGVDEAAARRLEPGGLAGEELRPPRAGPVARAAGSAGRPGSVNRNLRHSCTSRSVRRTPPRPRPAWAAGARPGREQAGPRRAARRRTTRRARRGPRRRPGRVDRSTASACRAGPPAPRRRAASTSGAANGLIQMLSVRLGVAQERQLRRAAASAAPRSRGSGRRTTRSPAPSQAASRGGRSGRPRRRGGVVARSVRRGSRGPPAAGSAPASPARTIREIAVRTAGAAIPTGSSSRTRAATGRLVAAGAQVVAVQVEEGRPGVHAVTVPVSPSTPGTGFATRRPHRG